MAVLLLFVLLLVHASPVRAQEDSLRRDVPPTSYQILDAGLFGRRSALQKKLDEASSHGYHLVNGFERVLVVRKAPNDERYVYTTEANGDIESLERQINAAAARGFRLVPEAVLGSVGLAVMEKRVAASPRGAEYRLLSFKTDSEMYDMGPGLAVSGGFDTDRIDERLAEMAVAGYRLVALVTRTVDERATNEPVVGGLLGKVLGKGFLGKGLTVEKNSVRRELLVFFEKGTDAPVVKTVREAARRYHVVTAGTEAEFEARLNRAAAAGYRLLAAAENGFPETIAVVEKLAPTAARPTYRVLAPSTISSAADDLSQAAAAGWFPHSRGVLDPSGGRADMPRVLLVLDREEPPTAGALLVLAAKRSSTLAKELNEATAAGFQLVAGGAGRGELLLVLRRK